VYNRYLEEDAAFSVAVRRATALPPTLSFEYVTIDDLKVV